MEAFFVNIFEDRTQTKDGGVGLVVMGALLSRGCEIGSQYCILDGYLYTLYCSKNCNVCVKRPKINQK